MAGTPRHSVSVAGVVVDQSGMVLVIRRRDNGHWEVPGGVLELAETPEHGVKREVLEETGIEVRVRNLTGVYKNMERGVVALVFSCEPIGGFSTSTDESSSVRWMPVDSAVTVMDPAYGIRVEDAFRDGVPVRVHDGKHLVS